MVGYYICNFPMHSNPLNISTKYSEIILSGYILTPHPMKKISEIDHRPIIQGGKSKWCILHIISAILRQILDDWIPGSTGYDDISCTKLSLCTVDLVCLSLSLISTIPYHTQITNFVGWTEKCP